DMHVVDAERLAAVIERAAARSVGIGQRVALREEVPLLVDRAEGFIPHFVVDDDKLAEVRARAILNDRLPPAPHLGGLTRADRIWFRKVIFTQWPWLPRMTRGWM